MASSTGPEPRIAYLVKRVERGLRARLDQALSASGVSTPEYTALSILGARDGLSSAQLARRVFVTPQAMNQIVLGLEERGLIQRKVSASHGRVMQISLTARGWAVLGVCDRVTLPIEERLLASLSRADAAALRRVLAACASALVDGDGPRGRAATEASEGAPRRGVSRARV